MRAGVMARRRKRCAAKSQQYFRASGRPCLPSQSRVCGTAVGRQIKRPGGKGGPPLNANGGRTLIASDCVTRRDPDNPPPQQTPSDEAPLRQKNL